MRNILFALGTVLLSPLMLIAHPDLARPRVVPIQLEPIYRHQNVLSGDHCYINNLAEAERAIQDGYQYEGIGFYVAKEERRNLVPLFRYFDGRYHYLNTTGRSNWPGAALEGPIGFVAERQLPGTVPLHRWVLRNGKEFYTTDPQGELAPQGGYRNAGVVGYVFNEPAR